MTLRSILTMSAIIVATGCAQKSELPVEAKRVGLHSFKVQCLGSELKTVSIVGRGVADALKRYKSMNAQKICSLLEYVQYHEGSEGDYNKQTEKEFQEIAARQIAFEKKQRLQEQLEEEQRQAELKAERQRRNRKLTNACRNFGFSSNTPELANCVKDLVLAMQAEEREERLASNLRSEVARQGELNRQKQQKVADQASWDARLQRISDYYNTSRIIKNNNQNTDCITGGLNCLNR